MGGFVDHDDVCLLHAYYYLLARVMIVRGKFD